MTGAGGVVELGFFNKATAYRLRPEVDSPPARAQWVCETGDERGDTHLIFVLAPLGSGSVLRFAHAGWKAETDYFFSCTTTWGELMFRLRAAAEGKSRGTAVSC